MRRHAQVLDWWEQILSVPAVVPTVQIVPLSEIEPPTRNSAIPPFKKYKLIPVLFGFQSPESPLPPVEVLLKDRPDQFRFTVYNGYHRYYASIAVDIKTYQ
jgi:hypothetical protein